MASRAAALAALLWIGVACAEAPATQPNAFSTLKHKLVSGESAVLLIISDSTGYRDESGTRRFIRWLATQYPTHRTTELRWAEWTSHGATGPKEYEPPRLLGEGTTGAAFTILDAVLPGAVAQRMVDHSRWTAMLAPLSGRAPDLLLWNHGHNHQGNIPPAFTGYGRGTFLAPLGRLAWEFPDTPQAAIVQNPWRDNDGYQRVREWWQATAAVTPGLTLVDGYTPFIDRSKSAALYQDNVHPSAAGYELICQQLVAAWTGASTEVRPVPPSWVRTKGDVLNENGDLADWTGAVPAHWRLMHAGAVAKDTTHTFNHAACSLAVTATKQNDGVDIPLSPAALARSRGKTVSVAILAYVPSAAEQDLQVKFTTSSTDQVTGSMLYARDNWKWIVLAGCPVPPDAKYANVGIFRSFAKPPTTDVPFYLQRALIVAGDAPCGGL